MPQQMIDEAGNVWNVDASGNPTGLVTPAPPRPGGVFTLPPSAVQASEIGARPVDSPGKQIENTVKAATAAPTIATAQSNAIEAKAKADTAARNAALVPPVGVIDANRSLSNDEIFNNIQNARGYSNSWDATGIPYQLIHGWGGNDANRLDSTIESLHAQIGKSQMAMGRADNVGGGAAPRITQTEFKAFADSLAPLHPENGQAALQAALGVVDQHYRRLKAAQDGKNPDDPQVQAAYGILPPQANTAPVAIGGSVPPTPPGGAPPGGGQPPAGPLPPLPSGSPPVPPGPMAGGGPTTGGMGASAGKLVADPILSGVNSHVQGMITGGASSAQVQAYLESVRPGLSNSVPDIDQAIAAHNAQPNRPVVVDVEKAWQPASPLNRTLGTAAMSPLGTAAINAADMLSMGTLDNMTSNPAETRALMAGVSSANPYSALAGQIGGGALGASLAELGAARAGLTGIKAARAADMAYGAAYGAGSADGNGPDGGGLTDRLASAGVGAATGLAGGMFGRTLARGGGALVSGAINPAAKMLSDTGIPLTIGQALGGGAKALEDKMTSWPIVGGMINARRAEGYVGANNAAFNLGLQPIGADVGKQTGEGAVSTAQDAVSNAYSDALDGRTFQADPQFALDLHNAKMQGSQIPQLGDQFGKMIDSRVSSLFDNGQITGRGFRDALRGVRKGAASAQKEIMGHEFGQASGNVEDALRGLVQRQAPDMLPKYDAANEAYRNLSVLQNAVRAGKNTDGIFSPAQLGIASDANGMKFGSAGQSAAGDRPFFDFQRAAQNTLPSKIPDSGTASRLATMGMFGSLAGLGATGGGIAAGADHRSEGASEGAGLGLTLAAIAAAPYSKASQKLLQSLMLNERPAVVQAFGRGITNNAPAAGRLGTAGGLSYLSGQ